MVNGGAMDAYGQFVRQTVILIAYPDTPDISAPTRPDGSLDVLEVIKSSLPLFDKALIARAGRFSYKVAPTSVNNQYHTGNQYCDIVSELMATETKQQIQKHVDRTVAYKQSIEADEAWVIHFTREDDYLRKTPYWPSDDKGVNMIMAQRSLY
ncbi:hypothetical protein BGZ65_010619 [Modicella reniformis]|uniref:Uncharacterized protein n=1 Tax=Modicella reniformis TaxID=1440133 RepID=A0A9P6LW46_9FUNG|nr:hypothetical protein BGZ65_010619 [Modicella reniformis]